MLLLSGQGCGSSSSLQAVNKLIEQINANKKNKFFFILKKTYLVNKKISQEIIVSILKRKCKGTLFRNTEQGLF